MKSKKRRKYSSEYKQRAVRMSYSSDRTIKEVADSLGIYTSLLHRWRKEYTSTRTRRFSVKSSFSG